MRLIVLTFTCAGCGELNESTADPSAGRRQSYVEDCQVCCRANVLDVTVDEDSGEATAEASLEDG